MSVVAASLVDELVVPRPSRARVYLMAARPQTLTVAVSAVLVGAAAAYREHPLRMGALAAALVSAMLIQIGTNLANDVFDAEKGADTHARLGPTRVVQAGLLSARTVKAAMVVSFALATLAGAYLAAVGGWPIIVIGLASIASGIAYTGGPWPLGYNGLGDVFVFAFFGPVAVGGTAWVTTGSFSPLALAASVPVAAIATAVLVVNNVRDHATDRVAGKRTLVVRWGRAFGVAEYRALLVLAYGTPLVLALWLRAPWLCAPLATLPLALRAERVVARESDGAALNTALARTAQLLFLYSLLLAAALVLA